MRGLYARNLATAEGIRTELEEAGIAVLGVKDVDLLTEGASLVPKMAVLVELAERDVSRAVEALEERAPQLLEWVEDLSHLSPLAPFPPGPGDEALAEASQTSTDLRSAWESDPTAWSKDLFSDDNQLSDSVLAWIESSTTPTPPQIGKALERAIVENREDLIWPLCRQLKPIVEDLFTAGGAAILGDNPLVAAMRERAPGARSMIESLLELGWNPSATARRNFCLAAGQIESETFLPVLVSLLDDPDEEVRYEASGALYGMVHQDFDYDSEAPAEERALAVARWREWLARRHGGSPWSS